MYKLRTAIILTFILCILLLTSTAFAEKQEWVDQYFDFKQVKRILVYNPKVAEHLLNGINEKEIQEIFIAKLKFPKEIQVITFSDYLKLITNDTGINPMLLYSTDPKKAIEILTENIPKYADISISANVLEYSIGSEYREGYTYQTTAYQTTYVYGRGGTTTIQYPVTTNHQVSGRNVPVAYSSIRWDVYYTKTDTAIFSRLEDRARANPTILNNTKPKDLYGRILDSFFDDLSDKIQKGK